jgi:Secretion system C-terminal sorting domain
MKKIYTVIAAVAVVFSANAQKMVSTSTPLSSAGLPTISAERTVTDTIVGISWTSATAAPTVIGSINGGYVCGNNGYGDAQKAQGFVNSIGNIAVEGAIIWFAGKESDAGSSATSKVQVREYSLNGAGTNTSGPVTTAPGTVNASVDILYAAIDTGSSFTSAMTIMFTTPVLTASDFAIGVNFATLAAGDTVGIVSSSDGDAAGSDYSWEDWSPSAWHTMFQAWPLDIDFFIWALVDANPNGIEEQGFLNGARLSQNVPNPANAGSTIVGYELENSANNVSLMIFDVTGKLVGTYNEGNQAAGKHSINVSTLNLDAGVYYYALTAGKGRIAHKMVVGK